MKQFLYFLTNAQGQSFRINENNIVVTSTLPVPQNHAPDGWQDKMVQFARSAKYFGLFRGFTIPLRFVKGSAKILRNLQYGSGFEAVGYLIILKLNPKTMQYESWYKGEIDLSKMSDRKNFVEVNVLEGGTRKLLTANEDKTFEFPLDVTAEILELDGILLKNSVSYIIQSGAGAAYPITLLGCIFLNQEGVFRDIIFNSTSSLKKADDGNFDPSTDYIIRNDSDSAITFSLTSKYDVTREFNGVYSVSASIRDESSSIISSVVIFNSGPQPGGGIINVEWDYTATLQNGYRLYLVAHGGSQLPFDPLVYLEGGTLTISFDYRMPPTRHRALKAESLAQKLGAKVTEDTASCIAPALAMTGSGTESDPARSLLIISGDGIRRFDTAVVKTSFNDFFKAMNVVRFLGLDVVDEQIRIDHRHLFFTGDVAYDFGEVKDCEITLAEDLVYNLVKVGYPDQDFEDVNGRTEFNTVQEYGLPITRIVRELDLVSPYRADSYGIEYTRINMEGKTTTDTTSDNDVFIIDCYGIIEDSVMVWRPFRYPYTEMQGVLTDTVFNVQLSPKRMLTLHFPELAPMFYKMVAKDVTYQTSDKNGDLVTIIDDGVVQQTIAERDPVPAVAERAIFLPYYFEIVTKVPVNFLQIMAAARAGKFRFTWRGDSYTGFLIEGGIKPATMEEQTIKLIAAADNDLRKLIR